MGSGDIDVKTTANQTFYQGENESGWEWLTVPRDWGWKKGAPCGPNVVHFVSGHNKMGLVFLY